VGADDRLERGHDRLVATSSATSGSAITASMGPGIDPHLYRHASDVQRYDADLSSGLPSRRNGDALER
jgi:hypothetical protein